jgi:DNA-directed RNA polymerase specialized sigma24 family protein
MYNIIPQTEAARGDVSVLFSEHAAWLVALISEWLAPEDRGEAEDLAQDVWLAVWERAASGAPLGEPEGLLVDLAGRAVATFYGRMVVTSAVEAVAA